MKVTQLRSRLPLLPKAAELLSSDLAVVREGDKFLLLNASGVIYQCKQDDELGVRVGGALAVHLGLAPLTAVARACGLHRATLHRDRTKLATGGVEALRARKRGPKGPHKLTPEVLADAQSRLDSGESLRDVGSHVGVSEFAVRHAIKRGLLRRLQTATTPAPTNPAVSVETRTQPTKRAEEDQSCEAGVAVKRTLERTLASLGKLEQAAPVFAPAEAVPGAGVLLALPALLEQGLLEVGTEVYTALRNGFFGLRSVLLTFAFMALLRIKTPEQLTEHAPGEMGFLLGLDRAPEVKTLRRKLRELGERQLARTFAQRLTERWAKDGSRELGILYIDGHVRPYHGRTHVLPKHHVPQRGRPWPGTKDIHVNDRGAEPLFFVTAAANEGLLATLDATLLPEIRRLVGPRRRVTIVFDREGWSPILFAKWEKQSFDVLTYRKGKRPQWREKSFKDVTGTVGGEKVAYRLAERTVKLSNGMRVREIRRSTDNGHQTAVITTAKKLPMLAVAHRMFSRWRQENFFRYMRHEFALDHLCTNEVEPADPKRLVKNPKRKQLEARLRQIRAARAKLVVRRNDLRPGQTITVRKTRLDLDAIDQLIQKHESEAERLATQIEDLPKLIPIDEVLAATTIVQLERERKILVDAIKLTAYRAESSLARLVGPSFSRHEEEGRKLLKSIFQATADIIPDEQARQLIVRFHGLANPRATQALGRLCELVNEQETVYPGTALRLRFEAPPSRQ
jgi:hypothetical protein